MPTLFRSREQGVEKSGTDPQTGSLDPAGKSARATPAPSDNGRVIS
jgi:hypothetical protein